MTNGPSRRHSLRVADRPAPHQAIFDQPLRLACAIAEDLIDMVAKVGAERDVDIDENGIPAKPAFKPLKMASAIPGESSRR
jgi:hypothetical protein